jgi:defect-in-organelle-trafficking protein DotC
MRLRLTRIAILVGFVAFTKAVSAEPMTLDEAQHFYNQSDRVTESADDAAGATEAIKSQKNVAAQARAQAIFDTALGVGVKGGLAWQLENIRRAVDKRHRQFDTLYDFSRLLIQDRVVPAVISEARDLYNQDGDRTLRLSGAHYKIEASPRFSSTAPSWRDYLTFPASKLTRETLMGALMPRNKEEETVWRHAVADGWKQGVEQANLMLRAGLDRLNRDFTGMIRFHTFVVEGKISMPAIASERIPVTKDGSSMSVDETLLRITTMPEFDARMAKWNAIIRPSKAIRRSVSHD